MAAVEVARADAVGVKVVSRESNTVERYEPEIIRVMHEWDRAEGPIGKGQTPWYGNPKDFRSEYLYVGAAIDVLELRGVPPPYSLKQVREVAAEPGKPPMGAPVLKMYKVRCAQELADRKQNREPKARGASVSPTERRGGRGGRSLSGDRRERPPTKKPRVETRSRQPSTSPSRGRRGWEVENDPDWARESPPRDKERKKGKSGKGSSSDAGQTPKKKKKEKDKKRDKERHDSDGAVRHRSSSSQSSPKGKREDGWQKVSRHSHRENSPESSEVFITDAERANAQVPGSNEYARRKAAEEAGGGEEFKQPLPPPPKPTVTETGGDTVDVDDPAQIRLLVPSKRAYQTVTAPDGEQHILMFGADAPANKEAQGRSKKQSKGNGPPRGGAGAQGISAGQTQAPFPNPAGPRMIPPRGTSPLNRQPTAHPGGRGGAQTTESKPRPPPTGGSLGTARYAEVVRAAAPTVPTPKGPAPFAPIGSYTSLGSVTSRAGGSESSGAGGSLTTRPKIPASTSAQAVPSCGSSSTKSTGQPAQSTLRQTVEKEKPAEPNAFNFNAVLLEGGPEALVQQAHEFAEERLLESLGRLKQRMDLQAQVDDALAGIGHGESTKRLVNAASELAEEVGVTNDRKQYS